MGTRQLGVVLAAILCLAAVIGAAGGTVTGATDATGPTGSSIAGSSTIDSPAASSVSSSTAGAAAQTGTGGVTPDTVVMDVNVHENGTATWEVVYRTRLDDPETTAAFESLQSDVENNSTEYSDQFARRMTDTIAGAEDATGREMSGENFDVRAETRQFPQRYGIVVYSFRWTGFAAVTDDELRIGDAISGLPLDEKTRLLVTWPEEYEATTIQPTPDQERTTAAVWTGPMEFASNEPRIVVSPPGTGTPEIPWATVAAALGVLALVVGGLTAGWWLYRRRDGDGDGRTDRPPENLLSNEERVIRLLERQGGRIKQRAIVDELGWTEAKTSQVVGSLRDQGKIESFRLGRENVLALPQEEP